MAEQQTIKYAPQWNNMTVDNVTFQTNNVVGNFNYLPNVPAYKPIINFLLNCPLKKAFTNCPSVVYQNFLMEFWSIVVAYDPFPSTDETEQCLLREFLIKFLVLNGQRPLTLDFNTFCLSTGLDYNNGKYVANPIPEAVLGGNYSSTEQVNSIQQLLAYYLITGIKKDSVSPLPLSAKPKKGKSQTVTPTLPKLQGPEASRSLSKKRQKPKSKKPPTKTKEISPKPTEGYEQSHPVSSGTVPDPQNLERNIQLASTGLPSILDEGTRISQPLPEGPVTHPKDSRGNIQPFDRDLTSTTSNEGMAKTTPRPKGSLGEKDSGGGGTYHPLIWNQSTLLLLILQALVLNVISLLLSDDEAQESEEDILGAGSDTDTSYDYILKKYDNTLPLTKRQLVKYLKKVSNALFVKITEDNWEKQEETAVNYANLKASIDEYYDENIAHRDQTDKLVEASMSSLEKSSNTISDLYKGFNIITELLKEIKNAIKDDPIINKKINKATESFTKISTNITEVLCLVKGFNFYDLQSFVNALQAHALKHDEELAAWAKSSTNMAWNLGPRLSGQSSGSFTQTLALTHIPANVERENDTNTATEDPPSHTEGETDANRKEKSKEPKHSTDANIELIGSSKPQPSITQAQPITIINLEPIIPQREGKAIIPYTINGEVYYLTVEQLQAHIDKEDQIKKAEEEARLFSISKPEVIKVVQEEAKKLRIHPKEVITTKAGEKFKKAQDAEHEVLKRQHTRRYEMIRKILKELRIKPELPAPTPEQASSKSLRKKRKHMELDPEIKIPRLECNRALLENVPFVNNMVIEEPKHEIFFTDEFGDQAFQIWSDIDKVGMEALMSYLVAASMVQSPENARFSMKLKKLIAKHPNQEKLK
ncbi:hypothetical protein Tco_0164507 [Tanacetum coccineum]